MASSVDAISQFLTKVSEFGDRDCIVYDDKTYDYSALFSGIERKVSEIVKAGIEEGDVVFLLGDYSFESICYFFALAVKKTIVVPVTSKVQHEIDERINETLPNWLVDLNRKSITRLNQESITHHFITDIRNQSDSGLILFSSGSTGKPKAMIHSLSALLCNFLDKRPKRLSFLVFLMFDHIGGLNTLFNCLAMGANIIIPSNREPDHICGLIEKYKINILPASPTFLNLLMINKAHEMHDLSSLKMITYGTEPMPESLLKRLKSEFGSVKFLQTFGTSETGIVTTSSKSSESTLMKIEDPNQEYQIVKGELWLRSNTQVLGYINHDNQSFTEDGWFMTGDKVEETDDGYIKIVGRLKEVINVGGQKVIPTEVESAILALDMVEDCVIYGQANSITGQMVVAEVVVNDESDLSYAKKVIKRHCRTLLDAYKIPSKIILLDKITHTERYKKVRKK